MWDMDERTLRQEESSAVCGGLCCSELQLGAKNQAQEEVSEAIVQNPVGSDWDCQSREEHFYPNGKSVQAV